MKKIFWAPCVLVCACIIQSCNNAGNNGRQDSVDSAKAVNKEVKPVEKDASDFAVKAADGGMMEVEAGKLARDKAINPRIRNFGDMMVKDHSDANSQLQRIASILNVALPDSVSNDSKKEIDALAKKNGREFDKAYMTMMLDDHEKDITEFRKAADNLSDSALKDFAVKTLPVLEKHLDSARSITGKK